MKLALIAASLLVAGSACAQAATLFSCRMDTQNRAGLVSPRIVLRHDEAARDAQVNDAIILAALGVPVQARVASDTSRSITFTWQFRGRDREGTTTTLRYRGTFTRSNGRFSLVVQPAVFSERTTGSGTCDTWPVE